MPSAPWCVQGCTGHCPPPPRAENVHMAIFLVMMILLMLVLMLMAVARCMKAEWFGAETVARESGTCSSCPALHCVAWYVSQQAHPHLSRRTAEHLCTCSHGAASSGAGFAAAKMGIAVRFFRAALPRLRTTVLLGGPACGGGVQGEGVASLH